MIQLYPFQNKGVGDIREAFRTYKRVLFVAPTGSGKTVTFSDICAKAIMKGSRVLVLSDRIEIFKQNLKAITNHEIKACLIDADNRQINGDSDLFFGMVETFKRRMALFIEMFNTPGSELDLIIVDEAHKQVYYKVFDAFPNVKVLGVTATPIGKKLHLYYDILIQSIDIPELIEQGFLSPCTGYEMVKDDFSDLKTDSSGEFTEKSNFEHFNKSKLYSGVVDAYLQKANDLKTIVFCVNIEHAEQTAKAFNTVGITARAISSNTPEADRKRWLDEHQRGVYNVLINANIFVAGYDDPSIECVIFNRATGSLSVWLQGAGRGSRIFPGKERFLLLDLGGNFRRHGLWSQPRKWSLEPPKKNKKGIGAMPVKECLQCAAMIPAIATKCTECGFEIPEGDKPLAEGKLVEVVDRSVPKEIVGKNISELNVQELISLEPSKMVKPVFIWRVLRAKGEDAIIEYAAKKGYKNGWIARQLSDMDSEAQAAGKVEFKDFVIKG